MIDGDVRELGPDGVVRLVLVGDQQEAIRIYCLADKLEHPSARQIIYNRSLDPVPPPFNSSDNGGLTGTAAALTSLLHHRLTSVTLPRTDPLGRPPTQVGLVWGVLYRQIVVCWESVGRGCSIACR